MAAVRGDVEAVAGGKRSGVALVGKAQARGTRQQQHPFAFVLVVPEAGRAGVAKRHDALDPDPGPAQQFVDGLGLATGGNGREKVHGTAARSSAARSQCANAAAASYVLCRKSSKAPPAEAVSRTAS